MSQVIERGKKASGTVDGTGKKPTKHKEMSLTCLCVCLVNWRRVLRV